MFSAFQFNLKRSWSFDTFRQNLEEFILAFLHLLSLNFLWFFSCGFLECSLALICSSWKTFSSWIRQRCPSRQIFSSHLYHILHLQLIWESPPRKRGFHYCFSSIIAVADVVISCCFPQRIVVTAMGRNGSKETNARFMVYYFRCKNTLIPP